MMKVVAVELRDKLALVTFTNGAPRRKLGRPGLERLRTILSKKLETKIDRVKLVPKLKSDRRTVFLVIPEKLLFPA